MGNLFIIIYFIAWLIVFSSFAILIEPTWYWTHRKGYSHPGWKFLVSLPLLLGLLGLTAVLIYAIYQLTDYWDSTLASYLYLYLLMFVVAFAGIGGSFLILRLLPKRKMRTAGSRRTKIPYGVMGFAVLILGGTFAFILRSYEMSWSSIFNCALIASVISGWMFYLNRRTKTPTVEGATSQDLRPPVLYLRSFDQEGNRFAEVSQQDAAKYSEVTSYTRSVLVYLTLEQFLSREINRSIGPFIALGNPEDYLPPEGAYRSYASDTGWQDFFKDLSDHSAALMMQVGNTENLNWELISIRERGLQEKLFVVTPPPVRKGSMHSISDALTRLTDRIKGIQPASWVGFAAILARAGYHPPNEDPGAGAVMSFDEHNQGMTLVSGAKTPAEYAQAISQRLGYPQMSQGNLGG